MRITACLGLGFGFVFGGFFFIFFFFFSYGREQLGKICGSRASSSAPFLLMPCVELFLEDEMSLGTFVAICCLSLLIRLS